MKRTLVALQTSPKGKRREIPGFYNLINNFPAEDARLGEKYLPFPFLLDQSQWKVQQGGYKITCRYSNWSHWSSPRALRRFNHQAAKSIISWADHFMKTWKIKVFFPPTPVCHGSSHWNSSSKWKWKNLKNIAKCSWATFLPILQICFFCVTFRTEFTGFDSFDSVTNWAFRHFSLHFSRTAWGNARRPESWKSEKQGEVSLAEGKNWRGGITTEKKKRRWNGEKGNPVSLCKCGNKGWKESPEWCALTRWLLLFKWEARTQHFPTLHDITSAPDRSPVFLYYLQFWKKV